MAPRYYMYKDHKCGGGWRPVVSGCSSGTLGLSNLISEVVESLCVSVKNPYEVISSTDMLSRIENFNDWVKKEKIERGESWDWRDEYVLIGSDVKALFPSLSVRRDLNQKPTLPPSPVLVGGGTIEIGGGENLPKNTPKKSPKDKKNPEKSDKKCQNNSNTIVEIEVMDLEGSKNKPRTPKIRKKTAVVREKMGQNHRESGQKWKMWTEFENAFCQLSENLGQKEYNTSKIRPKNGDLNAKTRQNDGVFGLVATDGERGDPPVKPPLKWRGQKLQSVVLTSREPELGSQNNCHVKKTLFLAKMKKILAKK